MGAAAFRLSPLGWCRGISQRDGERDACSVSSAQAPPVTMSGVPASPASMSPPAGGPAPPSGGGAPPPSAATGANPASTPSPNRGLEAAALARLAVYVQGLNALQAVMPVGSDIAIAVREAVSKVAKFVPPGSVSQGIQMTEAQRNLMQQKQMAPQIAAMRGAQTGGAPPGGPPPGPPPMQ